MKNRQLRHKPNQTLHYHTRITQQLFTQGNPIRFMYVGSQTEPNGLKSSSSTAPQTGNNIHQNRLLKSSPIEIGGSYNAFQSLPSFSCLQNYLPIRTLERNPVATIVLYQHEISRLMLVMKTIKGRVNLASVKMRINSRNQDKSWKRNEDNQILMDRHPNVIKYYAVKSQQKQTVILMEYCYQGNLTNLIKKWTKTKQKLSLISIYNILLQLLCGLTSLHGQGFTHRDIKPSNCLISSNGRLVIADLQSCSLKAFSQTQTGTPYYRAPETWVNDCQNATYGQKCDIWSFGCLTYELMTGRKPFQGRDVGELKTNIISSRYAFHPEEEQHYGQHLCNLMKRCLKQNPDQRPTARKLLIQSYQVALQKGLKQLPTNTELYIKTITLEKSKSKAKHRQLIQLKLKTVQLSLKQSQTHNAIHQPRSISRPRTTSCSRKASAIYSQSKNVINQATSTTKTHRISLSKHTAPLTSESQYVDKNSVMAFKILTGRKMSHFSGRRQTPTTQTDLASNPEYCQMVESTEFQV